MDSLDDKMNDTSLYYKISIKTSRRKKGIFIVEDTDSNLNYINIFRNWREEFTMEDIKKNMIKLSNDKSISIVRTRSGSYDEFSDMETDIIDKTCIPDDLWSLILEKISERNIRSIERKWSGKIRYQIIIYYSPFPHETRRNILYVMEIDYAISSGYLYSTTSITDIDIYYCIFTIDNEYEGCKELY